MAASGQEACEAVPSIRVAQGTDNTQRYRRTGGMRIETIKGPGEWPARRTYSQPAVNLGVGKNHTAMADMLQAMHGSMIHTLRGVAPKQPPPALEGVHTGRLR